MDWLNFFRITGYCILISGAICTVVVDNLKTNKLNYDNKRKDLKINELNSNIETANKLLIPFTEYAKQLFPQLNQKEALEKLYDQLKNKELNDYVSQLESDPELFEELFSKIKTIHIDSQYYSSFKNIFLLMAKRHEELGMNIHLQNSFIKSGNILIFKFPEQTIHDINIMPILSEYSPWLVRNFSKHELNLFSKVFINYIESSDIKKNAMTIYNFYNELVYAKFNIDSLNNELKNKIGTEKFIVFKTQMGNIDPRFHS